MVQPPVDLDKISQGVDVATRGLNGLADVWAKVELTKANAGLADAQATSVVQASAPSPNTNRILMVAGGLGAVALLWKVLK